MGSAVSSHARPDVDRGNSDDDTVFYDCVDVRDEAEANIEEIEFNSGSVARDDDEDDERADARNETNGSGRENGTTNSKRARANVDRLSPKFTPQKRRRRESKGKGDAGPVTSSPHAFELRWDRHLAALRSYKEGQNGESDELDVPPNFKTEDGLTLGKW